MLLVGRVRRNMKATVDTTPFCQPYLDGKPVRYAIEADDVEGYVKCYKTDESGEHVLVDRDNRDGPFTVIESRGTVTLECKSPRGCGNCPAHDDCTMRRPGR